MNESDNKNWKLKLRTGKLITPFKHFTLIADGFVDSELRDGLYCPLGNAMMGMSAWATSANEAIDLISMIAQKIGFIIDGEIEVYDSEPKEPPKDTVFGYDINFIPYSD